MSVTVHQSSIVEQGAELGEGVRIGPFCHVGAKVRLGDGVEVKSHVALFGHTRIGARTRVFPFASLGHEPQDLKYRGEETELEIGEDCIVREGVTMNPGTAGDRGKTTIGNRCVFLANSHVAHDCVLGDDIVFSNNVMLAGHCHVANNVIIGGGAGIHQFCRIGEYAFIGGLAGVGEDVIPYGVAVGNRANLGGLNIVGMKRANLSRDNIHNARRAYKDLFSSAMPLSETADSLAPELLADPVVAKIVEFVKSSENRPLCKPSRNEREP